MDSMTKLFQKYLSNQISREELETLMRYLGDKKNKEDFFLLLRQTSVETDVHVDQEQLDKLLKNLDDKLLDKIRQDAEQQPKPLYRKYQRLSRYIAAAVAVIVLGFVLERISHHGNTVEKHIEGAENLAHEAKDIAPGGSKALLVLESGQEYELDSLQNSVIVGSGDFSYPDGKEITSLQETQYATLHTPRKGKYNIILSDGTKVWLNASSSLKYPIRFLDAHSREVELEGEAYFEVKSEKSRPFFVKGQGQTVKVLGTHFNVNAYSDEPKIVTTLVEGSVEVLSKNTQHTILLKPGEQASFENGRFRRRHVDTSYYTSWMKNKFAFDKSELSVVLRQIERWYDVEFVGNTQSVKVDLWGALSQDVMLSELLEVLEMNTGLKFKREGRKIYMN